jgi:hypothetical protein
VSDSTQTPDDAAVPAYPTVPRTVNLVIAAVGAQVFFLLLRSLGVLGFSDQLQRLLIKSNRDLKPSNKNRKPLNEYVFGSHDVLHDLHSLRVSYVWQGVILAVALLLLAFSLRRTSTASVTRWALLIVMVITASPLQVIPPHGWPVLIQVGFVGSGVMSILAIVLLFVPESRAYFHGINDVRRAEYAAKSGATPGAPRPSLRSMFAPRPQQGVSLDKPGAKATSTSARAQQPGAKSKSRAEADAVARGAELARQRAKAASKSRRTDTS